MSLSALLSPAVMKMHQPRRDALQGTVVGKVVPGASMGQKLVLKRDQGQWLRVAELGTEGTREIPRPGTLRKFIWSVGDTLILQHVGIVGASKSHIFSYCWGLGHLQSHLCALVSLSAKSGG